MLTTNVAVLGGGMAGLLAAKAVEDLTGGVPPIFTDRHPRALGWADMAGIHVLHDRCSMNLNEMLVNNLVILPDGDKPELLAELSDWERKMANASYGSKVYGSRNASTSLMRMPGVIEGYDYVQAFNLLLGRYRSEFQIEKSVTEERLHEMSKEYDLVISTIPRYHVTPSWVQHPFAVAYVSQRPPVGFVAEKYMGEHFVVYNTDPSVAWSRTARVMQGRVEFWTTEYNSVPQYHIPDLRQVEKVMPSETFAFPTNVVMAGRFGKWMPGVLAHDAYWSTVTELRLLNA